jgi:hypothetical protein
VSHLLERFRLFCTAVTSRVSPSFLWTLTWGILASQ